MQAVNPSPSLPRAEAETLLAAALRGAEAAAEIIRTIYATPFAVRQKADLTPVTLADEQAEHAIIAALEAAAPGIPIIAEERVARAGLPSRAVPRYWLVDPLDGTRGFVDRSDEFSVNIGLIEGDRPVLGVIGVPTKHLLYAGAGAGTATRRREGGAPEPIAARVPPANAILLSSRLHGPSRRINAFLAAHPGMVQQPMGSAIKFCLLAEGAADHYLRYGPTCEWDTAAGHALLEAAGGSVTTLEGAPLLYGKSQCLNPGFYARGRS